MLLPHGNKFRKQELFNNLFCVDAFKENPTSEIWKLAVKGQVLQRKRFQNSRPFSWHQSLLVTFPTI